MGKEKIIGIKLKMSQHLNRLNNEEAVAFDGMFEEFCEVENRMMKRTLRETHSCPELASPIQEGDE